MLKPFQIRDLHGSSPSNPEEPSSSQGVVQLSSSDYDDLASTHPRARLTYIDDDDGDQITVGSSLELSERLDDPVDIAPRLASIHISDDTPVPMHIFDIRRSNSVTELWRRFETQTSNDRQVPVLGNDTPAVLEPPANAVDEIRHEEPILAHTSASAVPGPDSQTLLPAFEAELASLLGSTEEPPERAPQPEPQHAAEGVNLEEIPAIVADLASQILRHMSRGANMVQSELRTRLPELQRQVNDAQRHLPENMGAWLQSLLTTLETQMKTVLNNLPENRRQWADNGRQWAEEAIHAGRPVAENAAESLRTMASELNEAGRTLFAAFEHEFGRPASQQTNVTPDGTTSGGPSSSHTAVPPAVNNATAAPVNPETAIPQSVASDLRQENMPRSDQPPAPGLGNSSYIPIPTPGNVSRGPEMGCAMPTLPSMPYIPRLNPHLSGHPHPSYPEVPPPPRLMRPHDMNNWYPPPRPPLPTDLSHGHPTPPSFSQLSSLWNLYPKIPSFGPNAGSNNVDVASRTTSSGGMLTHKDAQVEESGNKTLFIGNVGFNVTERTVKDVFASKGFIVDVDLPLDAVSGKHAGFGYLQFPSIHPALAAMNALQGAHIDGHAINLELSDTAPNEDINSQGMTLNTSQPSLQSNTPKEATNFPEWKDKQRASIKRRKSVSFKEPLQAHSEPATFESQDAEPATGQATDVAQSSPLIDLSVDESIATPQPRPQSESESYWRVPGANGNAPELSVNLNPELEMSRFPPVSQLEAQLLAKQRRHDPASAAEGATTKPANQSAALGSPFHAQTQPLLPTQTPYVPYRSGPEESLQRSRTISHADSRGNYADSGTSLRRARTLTSDPSLGESRNNSRQFTEAPSSRLRRRASERQSMRPTRELDTWARLDRRERERSRPASRQSIPGSFPVEDPPNPPLDTHANNAKAADIERCISSLIDMGYGTAENGGRTRMAIYAAASNGNLLDAIEMIEEERKAYASHGQQ
ncbi:uncharacterized protein N7483_000305 [Penicillium malachiteum]|uniref:uncharacterized protein n=1 Tax=Penicillium malachiteum TaxID=1324776 RepID=UPI002547EA42|nr:uncharacterized protein N7483_000305 [Penicillium malachiteum]KAJ5735180.1 hypothetical protein N7483_000305 [Penicillium malachiteum]